MGKPKSMWEDFITLKSDDREPLSTVGYPREFIPAETVDTNSGFLHPLDQCEIEKCAAMDTSPIPDTGDREGYYGNQHFKYWISGLRDAKNILYAQTDSGTHERVFLDLGCASGRVVRHLAYLVPENARIYACDINYRHIRFIEENLPPHILAFQNTSLPHLPVPDESVGMVSAFSVFTHLDTLVSAWLCEVHRILLPGGLFWVTLHTDNTLMSMNVDWPIYKGLRNHHDFEDKMIGEPMEKDVYIFRWLKDRSYSANIFYKQDYILRVWTRYFEIVNKWPQFPGFQDSYLLRKK